MITLEHLSKVYGASGNVAAVDDVSLTVGSGEICVLIGPSGCGKTTTLRMVNRLITPTGGRVLIDGQDTTAVDTVALRRGIGYVIQQVGLFPNMTVEENIEVVPRLLGWDRARMRARAAELLDMVGLDVGQFLGRFPNQLSGGQQQRVGVARALAADPPVLLMDEPFGAIDPINRAAIQDQFLAMQQKLKKTVLLVSHDIDEAVKMADRIAIFRAGRLEQAGTPDEILVAPANDFVSGFVGPDRTLKRLRRQRVSQVHVPLVYSVGQQVEVAVDGCHGTIQVDAAGLVVAMTADGRAIGPVSVRMDSDLRVVVSELLRLAVPWLPCVDGEGRLRGVVSQAAISRQVSGAYGATSSDASSDQSGRNAGAP
jgi:osmoprotectant transport system ATP-binding protein